MTCRSRLTPIGYLVLAVTLIVIVVACSTEFVGSAPGKSFDLERSGAGSGYLTLDDHFALLGDAIPGFGGFFYDSTGKLSVVLTDPGAAAVARERVVAFLSARARSPERLEALGEETRDMKVRLGKYTFRELFAWYRQHVIPTATRDRGMTMLDIDERRNRISVFVRDESLIGPMRRLLNDLPVPEDAFVVSVRSGARPQSGTVTQSSLSDHTRPLLAGLRIHGSTGGDPHSCTLGFNLVPRLSGAVQAQRYVVTAGHCLPGLGQQQNGVIRQPANPYYVAAETSDPPYSITTAQNPACDSNSVCRFSEAVLAQYDYPSLSDHGRVAYPDVDETDYSNTLLITDTEEPYQGQLVYKIGATTGRQIGEVTESCAIVPYPGTNKTLLCQSVAEYDHDDGDSGAPVVVLSGGYAWAVGIHWTGVDEDHGAFSPISAALWEFYEDMGSSVVLDPIKLPTSPAPFQVTINGPATVGPNNYACSSWSAGVQGQSPFEYLWSGLFSSTEGTVSGTVPQSGGHLEVYVIDSQGNHGIGMIDIVYNPNNQDYCE